MPLLAWKQRRLEKNPKFPIKLPYMQEHAAAWQYLAKSSVPSVQVWGETALLSSSSPPFLPFTAQIRVPWQPSPKQTAWPCSGHTVEPVCMGQSGHPPEQCELIASGVHSVIPTSIQQLSGHNAEVHHHTSTLHSPRQALPSHCTKLLIEFFPQVAECMKAWLVSEFVTRG